MTTMTAELETTDEVAVAPGPATLAEYLEGLGDVDLSRILWTPRPGTATEADLLACGLKLVELIDGTLVRKTMGKRESNFVYSLCKFFIAWDPDESAGEIAVTDGLYRLTPGCIRSPDLSFTAWKSLPNSTAHIQSVAGYPPDLAVEILSESDRPGATRRKVREYFTNGTKLVWIFNPKAGSVIVYTSEVTSTTLTLSDTLDGGSVLPGLSIPLGRLFSSRNVNPVPETEA